MQTDRRCAADAIGTACALLSLLVACAAPEPPAANPAEGASVARLLEEAEVLRAQGDFASAIGAYERAQARMPWNDRITLALAAVYAERAAGHHRAGKLARAEADLRTALELVPDQPQVAANLARLLVERADLDLAQERAQLRRAEAETLAPGITAQVAGRDARLERRLDLAFELLERGQVEAGIARIEQLRRDYPEEPEPARMLAQAHAALGARYFDRGRFSDAADQFGRAVELYRTCGPSLCERAQVAPAHQNRIIALIESSRTREARAALDEAESQGMSFPELRAALPAYDFD